jgi:NAD(P)-dependent dehydrogenase (short-subunit alcohol dehydrogenase family)
VWQASAAVPAKAIESFKDGDPDAPLGPPRRDRPLVAFLAADAPAYITGQVWGVNGGLDM